MRMRLWTTRERLILRTAVLQHARANVAYASGSPVDISSVSDEDALKCTIPLDWHVISESLRTRTAAECCIRWYVHDHPGLNHGEWTEEEDERLDALSREHGERDWVAIATELGTNRTAISCFRRYQQRKLVLIRT